MSVETICALVSSISFFAYCAAYFTSAHMKEEFIRFGLAKLGLLIISLEILGATGLLVGLLFEPILMISSFGLSILMFCGLIVRFRLKDSLWVSLPALFYLGLNAYIFWSTIN